MRALAKIPKDAWPSKAFDLQQIADQLAYWREHLMEMKAGTVNSVLTPEEIRNSLDRWLDERLDLRGR